ncbi:hypothetical protein R1sor_026409 [Riccia sorocarpa]|uniref:Reverse transcriptase domain-containing protein n=1 Tax=Riccia sorocarpa TaxID=122646 RepID=A0ABD3GCS5_9MARC
MKTTIIPLFISTGSDNSHRRLRNFSLGNITGTVSSAVCSTYAKGTHQRRTFIVCGGSEQHAIVFEPSSSLTHVQHKLSPAQQTFLQEEPTPHEIDDLVNLLPHNKSPGIDALSADGLRKIWHILRTPTSKFMLHFWETQLILSQFMEAVICLLPKVDFPVTIGQWRPISLLSLHYKLLAKLLALRLALLLPSLLPPQQTGFIKSRSTLDNILVLQLTHEYLRSHKQSAIFLKLDLEKAYDRVSIQYLLLLLHRLNCGPLFIKLILALHTGATAKILADGEYSSKIHIHRGVRQGCPLARLLFAIATLPFISMLQSAVDSRQLQGVNLGPEGVIYASLYADDTAIFIQIHQPSVEILQRIISTFCAASGGSVNYSKSDLMTLGTPTTLPPWLSTYGW